MKGRQHGHNLRSAPHSERTVRANIRAGSKSRADSQLSRRSAPGDSELQQHRGSETLGPATRTQSGPAGDAPAAAQNMDIIAAQQQQMKMMQEMMSAMQQQMAAMQ